MDVRKISILIFSSTLLLASCAGQETETEIVVTAPLEEVEAPKFQNNLVYANDRFETDEYIMSEREKASIYRDLIRTSGIWLFPGIQR